MTYEIKNNRLYKDNLPVKHYDTKNKSGKINPKYIVIHYTAGSNFDGDVRVLSGQTGRKVSVHLVLSPKGEFVQIGDFNDRMWHCDPAHWDGLTGMNGHTIGIEVTCPGWVEDMGNGIYGRSDISGRYTRNQLVYAAHPNGGGKKWWVLFTKEQCDALKEVVPVLFNSYDIKEVVGHDQIAPERKIDPGPCLPKQVMDSLNGDRYDGDEIFNKEKYVVFNIDKNDTLNVRSEPNTDLSKILNKLKLGTVVLRKKTDGKWALIETSEGLTGYVMSKYIKPKF